MKEHKKRVDIVKIKMVKEGTIMYLPRRISSPSDCVDLVRKVIDESDREAFIVVTLDTKNQPTTIETCSVGTLNASVVHPREVFKTAILSNAASVIVAHNHPSGDPEPSNEDRIITKRLKQSGEILGINLLDHIIIGEDTYTSLKEQGGIE